MGVAITPGDFDGNGTVDADDIDILCDNLNSTDLFFDLTGDNLVDELDLDELVLVILGTAYGDANLDKKVDFLDFSALSSNFQGTGGWADGNFNCDTLVDFLDFSTLSSNFGFDGT